MLAIETQRGVRDATTGVRRGGQDDLPARLRRPDQGQAPGGDRARRELDRRAAIRDGRSRACSAANDRSRARWSSRWLASALACSATKKSSLLGIRAGAATLEQSSLEYALRGDLPRALALEEQALLAYRSVDDTARRHRRAQPGRQPPPAHRRQRRARASPTVEAQSLASVTGNRGEEAAARSNLGTRVRGVRRPRVGGRAVPGRARAGRGRRRRRDPGDDPQQPGAAGAPPAATPQQAIELFQSALEIDRKLGNEAGEANRLRNLGAVYAAVGRQADAVASLDAALEIDRRRENIPEIALDLATSERDQRARPGDAAARHQPAAPGRRHPPPDRPRRGAAARRGGHRGLVRPRAGGGRAPRRCPSSVRRPGYRPPAARRGCGPGAALTALAAGHPADLVGYDVAGSRRRAHARRPGRGGAI